MRKLIILICIIITAGAVYALVPQLFPDTPLFPRKPTGEGTLGKIIETIVGQAVSDAIDGTVVNTRRLNGISASGYLKNTSCSITEKWIGIDANGKAICGNSTPSLAYYGKITEQGCSANIYRSNGTSGTTNTGDTLQSGDILKTEACGLTIAFSDFSILRLDADTTVSLDIFQSPSEPGSTIASAILENGSLWGRILTTTGSYRIGTNDVVAGVRGTSIAVVQTGVTITIGEYRTETGKWTIHRTGSPSGAGITIPHSQSNANTITKNPLSTAPFTIRGGEGIMVTGMPISIISRSGLYTDSSWIRRNTRKDISYMYNILSSLDTNNSSYNRIRDELILSSPPQNSTDPETQNICESGEKWWTPRYGCQPSGLYAVADYTLATVPGLTSPSIVQNKGILLYSGSDMLTLLVATLGGNPTIDVNGIAVNDVGQYIKYEDQEFIANLSNKTVTIDVTGGVINGTLISFGGLNRIRKTPSGYQCMWSIPACNLTFTGNTVKFIAPSSISYFMVGNHLEEIGSSPGLNSPLGGTIKSIYIN